MLLSHTYDTAPDPNNFIDAPVQTIPSLLNVPEVSTLDAVIVGKVFTTTVALPTSLVQLLAFVILKL